MKRTVVSFLIFISGCDGTTIGGKQWTPEEQGAMIKRCEANGMDWHMFDFGRIVCHKKEALENLK